MKIKNLEEKQMVIHTKKKPKIHTKEKRQKKIKGKVRTVRRGARQKARYTSSTRTIRKAKEKAEKKGTDGKKKKTHVVSAKRVANVTLTTSELASEMVEGGKELKEAAYTAASVARPVIGIGSLGAKAYKSKKNREDRKRQEKAMGTTYGKNIKSGSIDTGARGTDLKSSFGNSERSVDKRIKVIKQSFSQSAKCKNGTLGSEASKGNNSKAAMRSRKIAYFLDKMKAEEEQKDSTGKLAKDIIKQKAAIQVKKFATSAIVFMAPMLLLIITVGALVTGVANILYNSPFSIFLPKIDDAPTVEEKTVEYYLNFDEEVRRLAAEHEGYDSAEIIYVGSDIGVPQFNIEDVVAVYMVKYGIGDTASAMSKESARRNLKTVFDDMCYYTLSSRVERFSTLNGVVSISILEINVNIRSIEEMQEIYGFDEEQRDLAREVKEMMLTREP